MLTARAAVLVLLVCTCAVLSCDRREPPPREPQREPATPTAAPTPQAPDSFLVGFSTNRGTLTLVVHRSWAPRGADRFYALVKSGFYDGARFFRVVRGFVVQFGLPADPQVGRTWSSQALADDPVRQPNRRGTLAFASAGPNTRTTQVFINQADNLRLDGLGFAPIGRVTERLGIVDSLYAQYGERPSQDSIERRGEAYLARAYPNLDRILSATIVREWR